MYACNFTIEFNDPVTHFGTECALCAFDVKSSGTNLIASKYSCTAYVQRKRVKGVLFMIVSGSR